MHRALVRLAGLAALGVLLALPSIARAQVINVQTLLSDETEEGWHAEATAGGSYLTGNVPFLTARGALLIRYDKDVNTVISSTTIDFGRGGGAPFLNRQTSHLRYQRELTETVTWEAFLQGTHDQVWRLNIRALVGTGGRFRIYQTDKTELVGGLGYFFEHERLSRQEDVGDSGLKRYNHRLGSYGTFAWKPDPVISLQQTVYFQPRLDDPTDLRLMSLTALGMKVKDNLAVSASLQIQYNTWTPETILKLDTTTLYQLTWTL